MSKEARQEAEKYIRQSLAAQKRLGYSGKVDAKVYEQTVDEAARAMDKLIKAQQRTGVAA